jgi:hypothetical protein
MDTAKDARVKRLLTGIAGGAAGLLLIRLRLGAAGGLDPLVLLFGLAALTGFAKSGTP